MILPVNVVEGNRIQTPAYPRANERSGSLAG